MNKDILHINSKTQMSIHSKKHVYVIDKKEAGQPHFTHLSKNTYEF